jgi:hypothetical protein
MKYKTHENIDFYNIYTEYKKSNLSLKEISEKYKIPTGTIYSRFAKYKFSNMNGGILINQNKINSEANINNNLENPFEIFERGYSKKVKSDEKKIFKEKPKNTDMSNADVNNKPKKRRINLDEEYNISGFLQEKDEKLRKIKNV